MSTHLKEAANQLGWWLRLPPTNLIDRGDHVRFRHALYLMIHQTATVLYGMNGLPETMYYPSRLEGARNRLNGLSRAPENAGDALWTLATERVPEKVWAAASRLMRDILKLLNEFGGEQDSLDQDIENGSFKPDQSRDPGELYALAAETAERIRLLEGASVVALGGSLGRGYADRQSDIDLLVFGPGIPREADRRRLITAWLKIRRDPLIEPACDSVVLDGAMIHIRYWSMQTVEDMLAEFPMPPEQRILAEELQNCHPLVDPDGRLKEWKAVLGRLPDELVRSVTAEAQHRLPLFRDQWQKAQDADDRIHLYCLANQAANDLLIALYIRNGRFLSVPKWMNRDIPSFNFLPAELGTRLPLLVDGMDERIDSESKWQVLEGFWEELVK
ncbi:MAG: nucleotidyltransferase domain-containing protein [Gemmatimonadetes bacterium]|nr:nucleotidyltransferase domain-containing protein [Gemmatimonadota bacterium]MYG86833.1 nucleotidyltransferase domain-containing protein [Gemmatimonadota bacterium]MYJ90192.1 nucleotidyltransferase domain-containing protein [Gemmatimonadota bacterium]